MIQSILLENFLAHKRTEIRLGPGMTVLTGANNCGKSAVVEGLRCVSQNPAPKHFIRHGAKEARVTVTVDDGTAVTWIRKKATVIYELLRPGAEEPEVFQKLRKGQVPDEVLDILRLDPVELKSGNPKRVDVHIGNQRTPIFLLGDDSADARMAEFFASSTEGAHLLSMQKLLKQRIREHKTGATATMQRMERLEADLDKLAPLPELGLALEQAQEMETAVNRSGSEIPRLERAMAEQEGVAKRLAQRSVRVNVLGALPPPPELNDTPALHGVLTGLTELKQGLDRGRKRSGALAPLAPPPELHSTTGIVDIIQHINHLTLRKKTIASRTAVLDGLQDPPMLHDEEPLAGMVRELSALKRRKDELATVLAAREAALERLVAEMEIRVREIGNCPICSNKLEPEMLMGGADDAS